MKQLLSSCDDSILVALGKKAYFFSEESDRVAELLKASNNKSSEKTNSAKNISFQDLDDILAVAVSKSKTDSTENWCAVARCNKTLAIYKIKKHENLEKLEYKVVYNTPKRVGQLCFAELPTGQNQQQHESSQESMMSSSSQKRKRNRGKSPLPLQLDSLQSLPKSPKKQPPPKKVFIGFEE